MLRVFPKDVYRHIHKGRENARNRRDRISHNRLEFHPAVFSLTFPVFFQDIGKSVQSIVLSVVRQFLGLMPLFYAFSFIGLDYAWIAFPVSEVVTTAIGFAMYIVQLKAWKREKALENGANHIVTKA